MAVNSGRLHFETVIASKYCNPFTHVGSLQENEVRVAWDIGQGILPQSLSEWPPRPMILTFRFEDRFFRVHAEKL